MGVRFSGSAFTYIATPPRILLMSIDDTETLSSDVVYFDFSNAFDSVNHDLILDKLKNWYSIDGILLKFLKNYLWDRQQRVVLDGVKSPRSMSYEGSPKD